jgi:hypothetical protein
MTIITPQQRLEAFALYTLALQHYAKVREFERGIARALDHDEEFVDHVSDAIYGGNDSTFDEILENAGYIVRPQKRKARR